MDKEVVVHIYNGVLLSHKKEWIRVSCSEVDEPRACYTEWSKSEREEYHTLMCISHNYLYPLPLETPLYPHPSPLGPCRALGRAAMLYGSFPLVIYFTRNARHMSCYFLNSSCPVLPLLCLPDCSLRLHFFSVNRFISTSFSRFHICALMYDILLFLIYFTLCNRL